MIAAIFLGAGITVMLYSVAALMARIHNKIKKDNALGWEWGDKFKWMHSEDYGE